MSHRITVSRQEFPEKPANSLTLGSVKPHVSGLLHTTGKATYLDDIPKQANELYAAVVISNRANSEIESIDASLCLQIDGVKGFFCHEDIKPSENNIWGHTRDEEYFASKKVLFVGQLIGLVVADTYKIAKSAAAHVIIKYKDLEPPILTIKDAIERNSFWDFNHTISRRESDYETDQKSNTNNNDITSNGNMDLTFEGECNIGGQEHFYLETHGCLVIPKQESDEIEVFSSTQNVSEAQQCISSALNIPENRINVRCKRLGGGFGGKETRGTLYSVVVAIAAKKLNRPVRLVVERDIDMLMTGKRHPFYARYKITVSPDGFFKDCEIKMISNAGHSVDLSIGVMMRALTHCDNCYNFKNFSVNGRLAKTNVASNTA